MYVLGVPYTPFYLRSSSTEILLYVLQLLRYVPHTVLPVLHTVVKGTVRSPPCIISGTVHTVILHSRYYRSRTYPLYVLSTVRTRFPIPQDQTILQFCELCRVWSIRCSGICSRCPHARQCSPKATNCDLGLLLCLPPKPWATHIGYKYNHLL